MENYGKLIFARRFELELARVMNSVKEKIANKFVNKAELAVNSSSRSKLKLFKISLSFSLMKLSRQAE